MMRRVIQCPDCGFKAVELVRPSKLLKQYCCLACEKVLSVTREDDCCVFCLYSTIGCRSFASSGGSN
ncbi:hypothetical protein EDC56_0833 [Sinobacterium caligoides]|uniref:Uncharacterized protein n=1 Tax=Sinobacterium caligoides TaxID=933926 RepID=A0A3N2DZK3_9GAMM|nr:hypothetical protein EDC56_0833 [Sinobacterium caligoides]